MKLGITMNLLNLFKLEYNKFLIPLTIIISIVMGYIAIVLTLTDPCGNAEGYCYGLLPLYAVALPATPAMSIINLLPIETWPIGNGSGNYLDIVLESFSILKLIPIYLIFLNTFLFGLLLTWIIIKIKNLDVKSRIKLASIKYLVYFFIWIIIFSIYILVKYPVAPYVADDKIVSSCTIKNNCLEHFIHYKTPNCDNEIKLFLFPFKRELRKDNCLFNNFIQNNPFKNIALQQDRYVVFTMDYGSPMERVINYFKEDLSYADNHKKLQFCESFALFNKEFCIITVGFVPENKNLESSNKVDFKLCKSTLIGQKWVSSELQKQCLKEYAGFEIFQISEQLFDTRYKKKWKYDESYNNRLGLIEEKPNFLDMGYILGIIIYDLPGKPSSWDEVWITEYSTNSSEFEHYNNISRGQLYSNNKKTRTNVSKVDINSHHVYIEHIKEINDIGVYDSYIIMHMVRKNTYIQIDGRAMKSMDEKEINELFLEIAKSIINQ